MTKGETSPNLSETLAAHNLELIYTQPETNIAVVKPSDVHIHQGMEEELPAVLAATKWDELEPNDFGAYEIHGKLVNAKPCYCVKVNPEDKVVLAYRGERTYPSPVVLNRAPDMSSDVTVILRELPEISEATEMQRILSIRTAYVGPTMPMEPYSDRLETMTLAAKLKSYAAWHDPEVDPKYAMVPEPGEKLRFVPEQLPHPNL